MSTLQIDDDQKDALTEMVSTGMGKAADVINQMLASRVTLEVPEVTSVKLSELSKELPWNEPMSSVQMNFSGDFQGFSSILFSPQSASNLVAALVDDEEGEGEDLDLVRHSTLKEVGNIVLNAVLGSLMNIMKMRIDYSLPEYNEGKLGQIVEQSHFSDDSYTLVAKTQFQVKDLEVKGDILMIFNMRSMTDILKHINSMLSA